MLKQNANIFNTCLSAVLHLRSKAKAQSKFKLPQVIKHTDTLLSNITIILDARQNANIFNTCLSAVLHLRSKAKAQSKFKLPQVIKHTDTLLSNITIILDARTKCQLIYSILVYQQFCT